MRSVILVAAMVLAEAIGGPMRLICILIGSIFFTVFFVMDMAELGQGRKEKEDEETA